MNKWYVGCLLTACAGIVGADTVTLTDGVKIKGIVTQPNQDVYVIQIGRGKMSVPAAGVAKVEKDDKTGPETPEEEATIKKMEDPLTARMGLDSKQRDAVQAECQRLWSEDEADRNAGRKKLLEMAKTMNVFQYIEQCLPYSTGLVAPELMRAIHDIDPKRAQPILEQQLENVDPRNRGRALELLAQDGKNANTTLLARGVLDLDPDVRIIATRALATLDAKAATPVLIQSLRNTDQRVRNVTSETLTKLWGNTEAKTPEDWEAFWTKQSAKIKTPILPKDLTPLVSAEDVAKAPPGHNE